MSYLGVQIPWVVIFINGAGGDGSSGQFVGLNEIANCVVAVFKADGGISPTDSVYLSQEVGVVVAVVVFDAAVVGTEFVTVLVVGVDKLLTIPDPGFGGDAVEVVVAISGGASIAV